MTVEEIESEEFYDLMQAYRITSPYNQEAVIEKFNAVKKWIREHTQSKQREQLTDERIQEESVKIKEHAFVTNYAFIPYNWIEGAKWARDQTQGEGGEPEGIANGVVAKYELKNGNILKDGHTMFLQDVVKDLQRKSYLEDKQ